MKIKDSKKNVSVHDPAVFRDFDGKFYIFGTHMTSAVSDNLLSWHGLTEGVSRNNPLFSGLLDSDAYRFTGYFGGKAPAMWAPDVWYCEEKHKYMMYFCTSSNYKKSSICLAEADKVTGPYRFKKVICSSGFTEETVPLTNLVELDRSRYYFEDGDYNNNLWPNAIDPNTFHDRNGRFWMVYGSWSGGIFLLEVDGKTGDVIRPAADKEIDPYFGRHLIGGFHRSMEGPFILYDDVKDWYYLFVSFGWLAADGGYQIRLFRSKTAEGPYLDMNGKRPIGAVKHEDYGVKLIGNHKHPSMEYPCLAPGHNSVLKTGDGGLFLVCHRRFKFGEDWHEPRVYPLYRTEDGWLTLSPFPYSGAEEKACDVPTDGWLSVDHGHDISSEIKLPVKCVKPSNCEFIKTRDEAGNDVFCASVLRDNRAIWYINYGEESLC